MNKTLQKYRKKLAEVVEFVEPGTKAVFMPSNAFNKSVIGPIGPFTPEDILYAIITLMGWVPMARGDVLALVKGSRVLLQTSWHSVELDLGSGEEPQAAELAYLLGLAQNEQDVAFLVVLYNLLSTREIASLKQAIQADKERGVVDKVADWLNEMGNRYPIADTVARLVGGEHDNR